MGLVPDLSTAQADDFFLFLANDNDFQASHVKMLNAPGAFITPKIGDRSNAGNGGITNDTRCYAYRITSDASGKKFFRFGVK